MDDIQMPSEVISQIISFQIPPQNNLEILAQESRQIFDWDEGCTILNNFATPVKMLPNI